MRWYDYLVCVACAWDITRGLFDGDIIRLAIGIAVYFGWELLREWEVNRGA